MKVAPFTKQEAFVLMRRFASITDTEFDHSHKRYVVRMVTIIPWQPQPKHDALAKLYQAFNHVSGITEATAGAYILSYPSDEFDVMLIATAKEGDTASIYSIPMTIQVSDGGECNYGFNLE